MSEDGHRVARDGVFGFWRLDPVPTEGETARFYESRYYDLIRKGGRAPELRRLMAGGEEAERERTWLRATLHADIGEVLRRHAPGRRVLDVGCGSGDLLASLRDLGFETVGVEPAVEAVELARSRNLEVHHGTLDECAGVLARGTGGAFDAAILLNVLEHVPDPVAFVRLSAGTLRRGGILVVRVPNDFTEIQEAARKATGAKRWWVAVPDHINYFDFDSLRALLEGTGFQTVHAQGDFPMETFLLFGEDYVADPEIGKACHRKRILFEERTPADLRRRMYQALAGVGVGRNCLVFGRLEAS